MRALLAWCIKRYQAAGGGQRFGFDCVFEPTCSEYAREAIERFGVIRGTVLAVRRIRRCIDDGADRKRIDPVPKRT